MWKQVEGWPYQVSSKGQVRRTDVLPYRVLVPMLVGRAGNKYEAVTLCRGGLFRTFKVHRLVAEAFLDPVPGKTLVLHKDGDRRNNTKKNLYYGDYVDNARDRRRHNDHALTLDQVEEVRRRRAAGEKGRDLAAEFGVSEQYVCDIHKGRK